MRRFLFILALRLNRTVAELLDSIDSRELIEWVVFNEQSPIGDERGDVQAAMGVAAIASVFGKRSYTVKECMPKWGGSQPKDWREMAAFLKGMAQVNYGINNQAIVGT